MSTEHVDAVVGGGLGAETVVPTPDGYSTIGELAVGDLVFGRDGHPTRVGAISEAILGPPCFVVNFSTGERVVTGADQRWLTDTFIERVREHKTKPGRSESSARIAYPHGSGGLHTTRIIGSSLRIHGNTNHAVRVAGGLHLPEDPLLPRHPYLLGRWLGARERKAPLSRQSDAIPVRYLRGSATQRRELLSGLLDKVGRPGMRGEVVFTTSAAHMAWDVHELTCSLGYRPLVTIDERRASRTHLREKLLHVTFVPDRPLFGKSGKNRIVAERAHTAGVSERHRYRHIVDARETARLPLRSIQVDAEDGLFLATRSLITVSSATSNPSAAA